MKIYLNPGHGAGGDYGACYHGRREADDVLALCLKLRDGLTAQGVEVRMSRETTDGEGPALKTITADANNWGADLVLAVHRNASVDATAHGVEIYIYNTSNGERKANAQTILDAAADASGMSSRGVKQRPDWAMLRDVKAPSYYLEYGFISCRDDNAKFDATLDASAEAITKALCSITGILYSDVPTVAPADPEEPTIIKPTRAIRLGDSGPDVAWVQQKLCDNGIGVGRAGVDGVCGTETAIAIKRYQTLKLLTVDGVAGVDTCSHLERRDVYNPFARPAANLRRGSRGDGVKWVQWYLVRKDYDIGASGIDGRYGASTEAAVRQIQQAYGLTVDGIVGARTRAALEASED